MKSKPEKPRSVAAVTEEKALKPPGASRQVTFHQLLVAARKKFFMDALSEALGTLDPSKVKEQVSQYIPADVQKLLASAGLRDEYVFPVPVLIEHKPSLIGYYRLLLGAPQKGFYKGTTGMGMFKSMEERGAISERQAARVPDFCKAMVEPLAELVRQIPNFADRDLRELPLLTFGSQLQGSNNTQIGKKAMQEIFVAIAEILNKHIVRRESNRLTVKNAAGRTVYVSLAHDPDVCIQDR